MSTDSDSSTLFGETIWVTPVAIITLVPGDVVLLNDALRTVESVVLTDHKIHPITVTTTCGEQVRGFRAQGIFRLIPAIFGDTGKSVYPMRIDAKTERWTLLHGEELANVK